MKFPASPFKFTLLTAICSLFSASVHAQNVNVTFSVDMNEYNGAFSTVYLNSSLNNWCGSCQPLQDNDNDGIRRRLQPCLSVPYTSSLGWMGSSRNFHGYNPQPHQDNWTVHQSYVDRLFRPDLANCLLGEVRRCGVTGSDCSNCSIRCISRPKRRSRRMRTAPGAGPELFQWPQQRCIRGQRWFLHLNIAQHNGRWYSTEVISEETMGYGVYTWVVDAQLGRWKPIRFWSFHLGQQHLPDSGQPEVDGRWPAGATSMSRTFCSIRFTGLVWTLQAGTYAEDQYPDSSLNGVTAHRLVWTVADHVEELGGLCRRAE